MTAPVKPNWRSVDRGGTRCRPVAGSRIDCVSASARSPASVPVVDVTLVALCAYDELAAVHAVKPTSNLEVVA